MLTFRFGRLGVYCILGVLLLTVLFCAWLLTPALPLPLSRIACTVSVMAIVLYAFRCWSRTYPMSATIHEDGSVDLRCLVRTVHLHVNDLGPVWLGRFVFLDYYGGFFFFNSSPRCIPLWDFLAAVKERNPQLVIKISHIIEAIRSQHASQTVVGSDDSHDGS